MAIQRTVLARLYEAADDDEAAMIESVAVRAGLVWKCDCCWTNDPKTKQCDRCKEPKR